MLLPQTKYVYIMNETFSSLLIIKLAQRCYYLLVLIFSKPFFKEISNCLVKMFISLKLFVWHLSRRIVRMESAGKWAAIYRKKPSREWLEKDQWESIISVQSLSCTRIYFCRQRAELEVLMKVASRADRWKGERSWPRIKNLLSS